MASIQYINMDKYSEVIHTANISNLDKVTGLGRAKRNRHQADWTPKQDEQKYKSNKGKLSSIGLRYRYCTISSACLRFCYGFAIDESTLCFENVPSFVIHFNCFIAQNTQSIFN